MFKHIASFLLAGFATSLKAQTPESGDIRLPISELLRLMSQRKDHGEESGNKPTHPAPVLIGTLLSISLKEGKPSLQASFRVMSFGEAPSPVPLFQGDLSVLTTTPDSEVLVRQGNHTCLLTRRVGLHELSLELVPSSPRKGSITFPECPSRMIQCDSIPEQQAIKISIGEHRSILHAGDRMALPMGEGPITWETISEEDIPKAPATPRPSQWAWNHEVLVLPANQHLEYRCESRATAPDGSGLQARLPLPIGAFDVQVISSDLMAHTTDLDPSGRPVLDIRWKTEGVRDRRIAVSYKLAANILDEQWNLMAPDGTTTRLLLASHPLLDYSAKAVGPAFTPRALPTDWSKALAGQSVHPVSGGGNPSIPITPKPLVETAAGVIAAANWELRMEPDGALIATGHLKVSHRTPFHLSWDPPAKMKLLTCDVDRNPAPPTRDDQGRLTLHLAGSGEDSEVTITFTGQVDQLDPLEGTMDLELPTFPAFIATLDWHIQLPAGYQSETSGNLTRISANHAPSSIHLRKNLCRGEPPRARIFYQRIQANQ